MDLTLEEKLFCNTWLDLRQRLLSDDGYDLIMASGLVRKLLIDGTALTHLANQRVRVKLNFPYHSEPIEKPANVHEIILRGFDDAPRGSLDRFLNTEVVYFHPYAYTALDVIRACANTYGGIHMSSVRDEREMHMASLRFQDHGIVFGDGVAENPMFWGVQRVAAHTLTSLLPLQRSLTKYAPRKRPVWNFIHKLFTGVPLRNRPGVK